MFYNNELEGRLNQLEKELKEARLNNWEFDIQCLKQEILEVEEELQRAYEG